LPRPLLRHCGQNTGVEGLVSHTPMTDIVRERGVFDRHPFLLVDVGCAGGIDDPWRAFGSSLIARGYDPDVAACEDAQNREPFPNVRYHARFVGLPESHPFVQQRRADAARWPNTNIWGRVTASELAGRAQESGANASPRLTDPASLLGVDDIVRDERLPTVDFLKVDVDGPDLEVLESAREVLGERQVLGVGLEVNWFGSGNPTEHTFHNTDRILREHGYTLFGLTIRHYSRTALPAPFEHEFYAQTRFGQPYQGDAIYVRDLAAPHEAELAEAYPADKLVKLACIYELIGLPDCAAEVLTHFRDRLTDLGDIDALLDGLTPPLLGERLSYHEYIARFERDPSQFLPSAERLVEAPATADGAPTSGQFGVIEPPPEPTGRLAGIRGAARRRLQR
jgi:Methyltransferase FkbM domain